MKRYTGRFLIALLAFTFALSPAISSAATETELTASIASVQSQIQTLQTQLSSLQAQLTELRSHPTIKVLPDAVVGTVYRQIINASIGSGNSRLQLMSGSLPPGLALSSNSECRTSNCEAGSVYVAGTPTTAGTYSFKIRIMDSRQGSSGMNTYTIKVLPSTTTTTIDLNASCPALTFSLDLDVGANNNDVVALQRFLKAKGFYSGDITGYFDSTLKVALASYEASKNISPATGYFGPIARAVANADCAVETTVATSTLILTSPSAPLRSQNYRNNGFDTLSGVVLSTFNLRSDTGDSKLTAVNTTIAGTGTLPTTVSLYNGTVLLKSKSVPSNGTASFDGLSLVVPKGTTATLTIKADFPSNTANGSSANLVVMSANYQSANGINLVTTAAPVVSANQYVYNAVAQFSLASTPTVVAMTDSNGRTTNVTASFSLSVQAIGGNVRMPLPADFGVKLAAPGGQKYSPTNVGVTVVPNVDIADGSTGSVTVTARWGSSTLAVAGPYIAAIDSIQWTIGSATVTQTYGLEDFKTPNAVNVVAEIPKTNTSFMSQAAGVWSAFLSLFGN